LEKDISTFRNHHSKFSHSSYEQNTITVMLSLTYQVHHEYNGQHRSPVTVTRNSGVEYNTCTRSTTNTKSFHNIYFNETYNDDDDDDDDLMILFDGKNNERYKDTVSLYHNTCLRYEDVEMAGPPVQPLDFPKPTVHRAIYEDARVLDHRSGRVQEATVMMKLSVGSDTENQRTDRAYLIRRKLSKNNSKGSSVRLCTVLRRRMTTYEGRINHRNSTTADWKTTDEHVVIKMSPLLNATVPSKRGAKQNDDSSTKGGFAYNRRVAKTAATSGNNALLKGKLSHLRL
jgi:hypothetical protein